MNKSLSATEKYLEIFSETSKRIGVDNRGEKDGDFHFRPITEDGVYEVKSTLFPEPNQIMVLMMDGKPYSYTNGMFGVCPLSKMKSITNGGWKRVGWLEWSDQIPPIAIAHRFP